MLRATIWFALVMLPAWWVLLFAGCEFEPSSIHLKHPPKRVVLDDTDGGR